MKNDEYRWGIDLGGTKIEGVVLTAAGEVVERKRIPTERTGGYAHIVNRITLLVEELASSVGQRPERIGVGTPGSIDPPTGLLKNANTVVLNGRPLQRDISDAIGCEVNMANDANCFAIAETKLGCVATTAPEAKVVFGVIMGTGVGGGLVVNGQLIGGAQGIGGEWGHMFLDHSGGYCYCGRVGCVETIFSGPALERHYTGLCAEIRSLKEIVERYRSEDDPAAKATMERLFHFFAKGIANLINVIDPDVVVLGGGLGQIDELYSQGIPRVADHLFNPRMDTLFLRPSLGDSAGVFGAAML